jgi:hypothetical protein
MSGSRIGVIALNSSLTAAYRIVTAIGNPRGPHGDRLGAGSARGSVGYFALGDRE